MIVCASNAKKHSDNTITMVQPIIRVLNLDLKFGHCIITQNILYKIFVMESVKGYQVGISLSISVNFSIQRTAGQGGYSVNQVSGISESQFRF